MKDLKKFLETIRSAADEGVSPAKRQKRLIPDDSSQSGKSPAFGTSEINRFEYVAKQLQRSINTIIEEAPTTDELLKIASDERIPPGDRTSAKNNGLLRMVAHLKSLHNKKLIPIFDVILNASINDDLRKALDKAVSGAATTVGEDQETVEAFDRITIDFASVGAKKGLPALPPIRDHKLRRKVFQHKSVAANKTYLNEEEIVQSHNERLEFLGDAVLNQLTTMILYKRFPYAKEGPLTHMRAELVCNRTLAELSMDYGLHRMLVCNIEEAALNTGKQKIYADIFEAYIGALATERQHQLDDVEIWLAAVMANRIDKMAEERRNDDKLNREAKNELYSLIGTAASHPQYKTVGGVATGTGPAGKFKVQCLMEGDLLGEAESANQRDAGLKAAMAALKNKSKLEKWAKRRQETDRTSSVVKTEAKKPSVELPLVADQSVIATKFAKNDLYSFLGKNLGLIPEYVTEKKGSNYVAYLKVKNIVISQAEDVSKKNAISRCAALVMENRHLLDEVI